MLSDLSSIAADMAPEPRAVGSPAARFEHMAKRRNRSVLSCLPITTINWFVSTFTTLIPNTLGYSSRCPDASNDTLAPAGTVAFASVDDVVAAAAGYRPLWNDTESGEDLLVPAAARNVSVLQERTMPAAQR